MDLLINADWTYWPVTIVGLLCYWWNVFDNESVRCDEQNKPFFVVNYLLKLRWRIPLISTLIIVTNVIWAEHIHGKHERAFVIFELFTLAWGGGSMLRMAMKVYDRIAVKFIEKFMGK